MVNECLLILRQRSIFITKEELPEGIVADEDTIEKMSAGEILQVIGGMPEGYRTVFNLYVIEGFSHREIAAMLEIAEGTSKSQLSKARSYLQNQLRKQGVVYEQ